MRGLCNIFQGKAQEGIKSEWIPFKISEAFSNSLAFPVQSPLIPYPPRFFLFFNFPLFTTEKKEKGIIKKTGQRLVVRILYCTKVPAIGNGLAMLGVFVVGERGGLKAEGDCGPSH